MSAALEACRDFVAAVNPKADETSECAIWERYGKEWARWYTTDFMADEDTYQMMSTYQVEREQVPDLPKPDAFVVLSTGWACPHDELTQSGDLRPSEHPNRKRVVVMICATVEGVASVTRFQVEDGESEDVELDEAGEGPLGLGVDVLAYTVFGSEFTARLIMSAASTLKEMPDDQRQRTFARVENLRKWVEFQERERELASGNASESERESDG